MKYFDKVKVAFRWNFRWLTIKKEFISSFNDFFNSLVAVIGLTLLLPILLLIFLFTPIRLLIDCFIMPLFEKHDKVSKILKK